MRATGPLFQFDPGWLFIFAGLSVCAAGVLLPAQADLHALEAQLAQLQAEEARAYQRLAAHADFIDQVERSDPAIIKRLAAAQLNLVPEGDTPLLLSSADASPVTDWIDAAGMKLDLRPPRPEPVSTLSRWTSGPERLWVFGAGIMAVFMGLLISPGAVRRRRSAAQVGEVVGVSGWDVGSDVAARETASDVGAACERGAGSLWVDEDEDATEVESVVPATVDLEEDEACEIADTVDLDPDEMLPPLVSRTVIADDGFADDAVEADVMEAAGDITLQGEEIEPGETESDDVNADAIGLIDEIGQVADPALQVIDAREGLGSGIDSGETAMLLDDVEGNDAGTGLLDAVGDAGSAGEECEDETADATIEVKASDVEHMPDLSEEVQEPAIVAEANVALETGCAQEPPGSESRATGGRRRPRRTRKRQEKHKEAPATATADNEPAAEEAMDASSPETEMDDEAASIPFLRNRSRARNT